MSDKPKTCEECAWYDPAPWHGHASREGSCSLDGEGVAKDKPACNSAVPPRTDGDGSGDAE